MRESLEGSELSSKQSNGEGRLSLVSNNSKVLFSTMRAFNMKKHRSRGSPMTSSKDSIHENSQDKQSQKETAPSDGNPSSREKKASECSPLEAPLRRPNQKRQYFPPGFFDVAAIESQLKNATLRKPVKPLAPNGAKREHLQESKPHSQRPEIPMAHSIFKTAAPEKKLGTRRKSNRPVVLKAELKKVPEQRLTMMRKFSDPSI